jgi:hypothetical protein
MKVRVEIQSMKEEFEAPDAASLLRMAKEEAARRAPFLLRAVVKNMSDMGFAAEVVKRHNAAKGTSDPAPRDAAAFLEWAKERNYITVIEE